MGQKETLGNEIEQIEPKGRTVGSEALGTQDEWVLQLGSLRGKGANAPGYLIV